MRSEEYEMWRDPVRCGALGLWLLLLTVPYLLAWRAAGPDWVYSGLLFNPLDGHTYLAKMRQGWQGAWTYRLAFTPQPGPGRPVFLFYLFGGHLARWLHLSLPLTFHLLRLSGALALFFALVRWLEQTLPDPTSRRWALFLVAFGGGLGWLAWPSGHLAADFWVAEAYPFLSALTNAHFPWALALMLILMLPRGCLAQGNVLRAMAAFLLGWLSPFGVALAGAVDVGMMLWSAERRRWLRRGLATALGAALPLGIAWWSVHSQPVLAGWNMQNLTPSLPWWDGLLAFSPALPMAIRALQQGIAERHRPLLVWVVAAGWFLLIPWGLQRRMTIGLLVPLSTLAAEAAVRWRPALRWGTLALALPTNLILIAAALFAAFHHDPHLYLTRSEADALAWVTTHTPPDTVVVAAPELGAFIPGQTGRFVVYGHPFESVPAEASRQALEDFYAGRLDADWLQQWPSVVVLFGPREQALGAAVTTLGLVVQYANAEVTVYGLSP